MPQEEERGGKDGRGRMGGEGSGKKGGVQYLSQTSNTSQSISVNNKKMFLIE